MLGFLNDSIDVRGAAHSPHRVGPRPVLYLALATLLAALLGGCPARHPASAEQHPGSDVPTEHKSSPTLAEPAPPPSVGSSRVSLATCGELTCDGAKPYCCLDGSTGGAWCTEKGPLEADNCPVDGRHHQLECGRATDCKAGERCCYFHQMSQCATECLHLGQLCDSDADCVHFAALGQPAHCRSVSETLPFLTACQVD